MKSRVYLETSVVSYLTALPSRDIVRAAHQQLTRDWWAAREQFELFTSIAEIHRGKIETMCRAAGLQPPLICTPEELLEE